MTCARFIQLLNFSQSLGLALNNNFRLMEEVKLQLFCDLSYSRGHVAFANTCFENYFHQIDLGCKSYFQVAHVCSLNFLYSCKFKNAKAVMVQKFKPNIRYIKVHIFWEGHKGLQNLHLTFDCMYCSQKLGEDFAKFCGLLRIYEL